MEIVLFLVWAGVASASAVLTLNEWRRAPALIPEGGLFVCIACCFFWPIVLPALMLYLWVHLASSMVPRSGQGGCRAAEKC